MEANYRETVDRVLMTVLGEAAFLNRLGSVFALGRSPSDRLLLGTYVPLEEVATHRGSDDDVGVVRIEHRLRNLVLAIECQLRPALHADAKQVNQAIRLVHVPLTALAVRS